MLTIFLYWYLFSSEFEKALKFISYFIGQTFHAFKIEDQRLVGELLWRSVAISLYSGEVNPPMVKIILHQKYPCLEGFLIRYCRQFPFPSFSLSQLNSLEHNSRSSSNSADGDQVLSKYIFIDQQTAILRFKIFQFSKKLIQGIY